MDNRDKAFLVQDIIRAQEFIDAIRADLEADDGQMSYFDQCAASDEIAFQQITIERAMAEL
jgi:hypothetical protein